MPQCGAYPRAGRRWQEKSPEASSAGNPRMMVMQVVVVVRGMCTAQRTAQRTCTHACMYTHIPDTYTRQVHSTTARLPTGRYLRTHHSHMEG